MMYRRNRFFRKHKANIIFGGLILGSLLFNAQDIQRNLQSLGNMKEEFRASTNQQLLLEEREKFDQAQAEVANQRMKRGCILIVDSRTAKNLVTLVEGQAVRDRTNKSNLPEGVTVCGANGETAVLRNNAQGLPVISDLAVGNRELVYDNLKRIRGAKVFYNTPEK